MLLERLSSQIGIRTERLEYFAQTASMRYYVFSIEKRTGGRRWIAHPSRPLKVLQRWLNSRVIRGIAVHHAATAYQPGANIRRNAMPHSSTNFTLRIDFKDFFPSFTSHHLRAFIKDNPTEFADWSERDINFFVSTVCRADALTIGAPSSPFLSNAMMFSFDAGVAKYCLEKNLIYTRYADDIFISSIEAGKLQDALSFVRDFSRDFRYANLKINEKKTVFLSRKYTRKITGLVITSNGYVSLGRSRKREIKALVFEFSMGTLPDDKLAYLKGLLAFASDVEPSFFVALTNKYGRAVISQLIGKEKTK